MIERKKKKKKNYHLEDFKDERQIEGESGRSLKKQKKEGEEAEREQSKHGGRDCSSSSSFS